MIAFDAVRQRRLIAAARLIQSDKPGERQAAVEAMLRLLPEDVSLADLLGRALAAPAAVVPVSATRSPWDVRSDPLRPWRNKARVLAAHREQLTERELEFVTNMASRRHPPTPKQQEWLDCLTDRFESRWAA